MFINLTKTCLYKICRKVDEYGYLEMNSCNGTRVTVVTEKRKIRCGCLEILKNQVHLNKCYKVPPNAESLLNLAAYCKQFRVLQL